jgi:hypothetical protein
VSANCDRDNIFIGLFIRKASVGGENTAANSIEALLTPIAHELITLRHDFPKTIVFTKLQWCGQGYEYIIRLLKMNNEENGLPLIDGTNLLMQYHASCMQEVETKLF